MTDIIFVADLEILTLLSVEILFDKVSILWLLNAWLFGRVASALKLLVPILPFLGPLIRASLDGRAS